MENELNKKRPLSEEDLEKVTGGTGSGNEEDTYPYPCTYCDEKFKTDAELQAHKKEIHRIMHVMH